MARLQAEFREVRASRVACIPDTKRGTPDRTGDHRTGLTSGLQHYGADAASGLTVSESALLIRNNCFPNAVKLFSKTAAAKRVVHGVATR